MIKIQIIETVAGTESKSYIEFGSFTKAYKHINIVYKQAKLLQDKRQVGRYQPYTLNIQTTLK